MTLRHPFSRHLPVRSLCLLLLLAVVALSGCSSIKGLFKKDKNANEGVPVEQLYGPGVKTDEQQRAKIAFGK